MNLPDDDVDAVKRMLQWLYTQQLKLTNIISEADSAACYLELAKLNTVVDKYNVMTLKNIIIDKLFELTKGPHNVKPPQMPIVYYIYNNTTASSAFRKVLVAWYTWNIDFEWYKKSSTQGILHSYSEFAGDLAIALARKSAFRETNPLLGPSSAFHETFPGKAMEGNST